MLSLYLLGWKHITQFLSHRERTAPFSVACDSQGEKGNSNFSSGHSPRHSRLPCQVAQKKKVSVSESQKEASVSAASTSAAASHGRNHLDGGSQPAFDNPRSRKPIDGSNRTRQFIDASTHAKTPTNQPCTLYLHATRLVPVPVHVSNACVPHLDTSAFS